VEDHESEISVTNLSRHYPTTTAEVLGLIHIGNSRRTQAQTDSNPVSSRSHAICQIVVESCDDLPDVAARHPIGKLSLIDLAGSERATTNTGIRLKESTKINCSLLALSNCINALCTQASFIPFRLSKLTRLLKDSLGGNCRTVCLSCISPSYLSYEDTYSTLQYANKTKNIRTNVTRNTLDVTARIAEYPRIIAELRAQVQLLQKGGATGASEFEAAIEEPFSHQKTAIQSLVARAATELAAADLPGQVLALKRAAGSDLRRRLGQKVAVFAAECNKRRPPAANISIDDAQRLRTLELENLALRGQLDFQERQLALHQSVVRQLMSPRIVESRIPLTEDPPLRTFVLSPVRNQPPPVLLPTQLPRLITDEQPQQKSRMKVLLEQLVQRVSEITAQMTSAQAASLLHTSPAALPAPASSGESL
jgi:hypothetical protein